MEFKLKIVQKSLLNIVARLAILVAVSFGFTMHLIAQNDSGTRLSQYLFPDFTYGIVKMKTRTGHNLKMNYNTVTEKMVFEKDGKLLDMTNIESVDTIYLQKMVFVPVNHVFYEVLVNAPVSLFVQHKSSLIEPGSPSGYGGTSQTSAINNISSIRLAGGTYNLELPSDYTVNPSPLFWIRKNNSFSGFSNKRQFLKIFSGESDKIEKFMEQNHIKVENQNDLIKLVNYCNEVFR
jgi:hypothetical protein